ncbi:bifunctional sterol desaturase/short chain dehydrogenase [Gloeothece verrucosa]|uniref:Alcohol dehydrogenase zinc-binding domain protein n=1 Tax=Gloeothece verrucosa (strain PCC 7822) TaxID=497965 RepID=E0UEY2_GLOV7|nr:bifunctional sterol desaturase/short chain dehydrogenase [Gloeothece verrucosa]ADN13112.1 Alcohol dehydrogenase zinc-binding domain protein [Gloeothece verrucosa PCC 7822]
MAIVITTALILTSIVWVEIVRDSYHALAHYWKPLYRLHVWHHKVFRPDLTPASEAIYRKAHWYNDVPEALVMLLLSFLPVLLSYNAQLPNFQAAWAGSIYTGLFLLSAIARGAGVPYMDELTDKTHRPGDFTSLPARWFVNRPYHWRHHFDNQNAYYSGTLTLVDKLMGTALSLKGKTVAVTGASGSLGKALLKYLHLAGANVIAITSSQQTLSIEVNGEVLPINTLSWQIGEESNLTQTLELTDILILNHGINVHGESTQEAITQSYEVNAFSSWRLMELFFTTVRTNKDKVLKEVWINTSEAEVSPAFSPLYELSKRTLGDLITLRRLDAPCVVRKLILGPFKSNLNPIGVMSADWVAQQIVNLAQRDMRNIIVTINPLTFIAFPLKEFFVSTYFQLFSRR